MLSQNNKSSVISDVGSSLILKRLVLSAKKGDKQAFEELYRRVYIPLYRYTISRCHDITLAEDICQQTILNFYKSLDTYEPEKSPLAYLFTIAKRLLINHKEKKTCTAVDEALLETYSDDSITIMEETHVRLLAESINDFLPHLTDDEQEVIRLYFYAEQSFKEISDILKKEEASVRKIKERALKKLRILTKHLYEGN